MTEEEKTVLNIMSNKETQVQVALGTYFSLRWEYIKKLRKSAEELFDNDGPGNQVLKIAEELLHQSVRVQYGVKVTVVDIGGWYAPKVCLPYCKLSNGQEFR